MQRTYIVASILKTLNRGVEFLQRGKPQQAASLYMDLLARQPGQPDALHLLAVAVFQLGDAKAAAEYARRAVEINPGSADYQSNLGRYHLALGGHERAREHLECALRLCPTHPMALMNMALVLSALGQKPAAVEHLQQYVALREREPGGYINLGNLLAELNRHEEAMRCFSRALELDPALAEAENNLASSLQALGQMEQALEHYEAALRLRPGYPEAWSNKGAALQALGQMEQARLCYEEALRLQPGLLQARGNMGNLLNDLGRPDEALVVFRQILQEAPQSAESWNNLGNCLQKLGRFEEAMEAYRAALEHKPDYYLVHNNIGNTLQRQGRHEEAVAAFGLALRGDPGFVEAMNNLGVTLQDSGRLEEAVAWFEKALALRPGYVDPLINMGNNWRDRGRPEEAIRCLRRALPLAPGNSHIWNNLGCALGDQGMVSGALDCYRKTMELVPDNHFAHSNLLLNLHYQGSHGEEEIFAAHREFAHRHETRLAHLRQPHTNVADPGRPLRIGYVSADFRRHSVAFFLEPLLERHHRDQFQLYLYADVTRPDDYTARFHAMAGPGWRPIRGFSHERMAALVRADQIDILVDVGGHTANSRLLDFAAAPAPVQVSYLGYPDTTGMDSIGYRITDDWADPAGLTEKWHTEELVRLPRGFLCYRPSPESPPVAPMPALAGEQFTFGSFNNMAKVSEAALDLWASVLNRTPGSRIVVKNKALSEPEARQRLQSQLAARGVAPQRVFMSGLINSLAGHLNSYALVDLALDTWPYHGTTTTCEALWMGVPVISLTGQTHLSRVGVSLLHALGLDQFAVGSPEDYIALAVRLAGEQSYLAELRQGMRALMQASPLVDEAGFTADLEDAYRRLWQKWCAGSKARQGDASG